MKWGRFHRCSSAAWNCGNKWCTLLHTHPPYECDNRIDIQHILHKWVFMTPFWDILIQFTFFFCKRLSFRKINLKMCFRVTRYNTVSRYRHNTTTYIPNFVTWPCRSSAVRRWLPTAAARVRVRAACGVCGGQSGTGAGFLRVLRFPLPIIPPISPLS
jgi:hypothetical protein